MPITRAQANQLLNQKEMALYDESRLNGLRQLDDKGISTRITRARAARDRARDLVRRQKLSSRASTGSKRGTTGAANQRSKDKAELMGDILVRFETRLRELEGKEASPKSRTTTTTTKKAAARKKVAPAKKAAKTTGTRSTSKKAPAKATKKAGKKTAAKNAGLAAPTRQATKKAGTAASTRKATKKAGTATPTRKAAKKAGTAAPTRQAARKTATGAAKSPATTRSTRSSANGAAAGRGNAAASSATANVNRKTPASPPGEARAPRSRPRKRGITPEQALAQTQALLEAKQARDQEPKPWADATGGGVDPGTPGYQSDSAARRAKRLHAAESRLPAIQGSASTRDRISQGKRDHRGDTGD